jgi:hypothetical protein
VKPSDIGSDSGELPQRKLNFPVDERADPPISIEDALAAGGALCTRHGGLIGQRGDKEGMVFLCTACGKYWRYVKAAHHSRQKLRYPATGLP